MFVGIESAIRSGVSPPIRIVNAVSTFEPKRFARLLRNAREELELRQVDIANRSGNPADPDARSITHGYISQLETARRTSPPSERMLEAIARGLGHKDSYTVKEWAGFTVPPDWSKLMRAIDGERHLAAEDKKILKLLVARLSGRSQG